MIWLHGHRGACPVSQVVFAHKITIYPYYWVHCSRVIFSRGSTRRATVFPRWWSNIRWWAVCISLRNFTSIYEKAGIYKPGSLDEMEFVHAVYIFSFSEYLLPICFPSWYFCDSKILSLNFFLPFNLFLNIFSAFLTLDRNFWKWCYQSIRWLKELGVQKPTRFFWITSIWRAHDIFPGFWWVDACQAAP